METVVDQKEPTGATNHLETFAQNPLRLLIEQMAARLAQEPGVEQIILYGSQATGEAHADSDIDLLLIKRTQESFITRCASVKKPFVT